MSDMKTILMVAAENDALPNAKVGGIGDVVRDLPKAIAKEGCRVHVIIPAYGFLHELGGAVQVAHFPVFFGGEVEHVDLYSVPLSSAKRDVYENADVEIYQWVLEHRLFSPCGKGMVYCNDSNDRPFATDAGKYALFCAAVGQAILNQAFGRLHVLHLHDWHAALLAVLRKFDPRYSSLKEIKTVYTIHNLALQGVRPLMGDASSLQAWFPPLEYDATLLCDPRVTHCINPMRAAIVLSDKVHAVSPTYAKEIQKTSDGQSFIYGGESLEYDLIAAENESRLLGILNGCEYPQGASYSKASKTGLIAAIDEQLTQWVSKSSILQSAHWIANKRLHKWAQKREKGIIVTSVGRVTEQKVRLLNLSLNYQGKIQTVLEHLLDALDDSGIFILLGSGEKTYEQFLLKVSGRRSNFIFLNGYADALSQVLYNSGDLFLMPSSFEPCGISQMLAMRAGQPCLVHGVGGLNDTVVDGVSGFSFRGGNGESQGVNLLTRFNEVLTLMDKEPKKYKTIAKAAAKTRFTWEVVAKEYLEKLY